MMPGIAIQPGFPIAGTPAVRKAAADDRFSHALHDRPKASAQSGGRTDRTAKNDAPDNSDEVREIPSRSGGKDDAVDRPLHAKDDSDRADDGDEKKDKEDKDGRALPLHMKAERALVPRWGGSSAAATAKGGSAPTGVADAAADAAASPAGGAKAVLSAGIAKLGVAALAQTSKGGASAAHVQTNPAGAGLPLKGVSVITATAAEAGKAAPDSASPAFMARVAASQHGAGPGGSLQGTRGAASTFAADAKADGVPQGFQALAGQGSGNAGSNPDGQGEDGNATPNKGAAGATQPAAGARGDGTGAPLPTAQMLPASGSAPSFAGALAHNGALARYAAASAAAFAAGTPAGSLPVRSLSIQLRPAELGAVTASLKYAGSGLTIDIQVETPEAQRRLSNDSSDIVKSLQSLGFQVDKVTVRQAPAQSQAQAQPQGQPQGQPMTQGGSAGGFADQGGAAFSMSGQSADGGHRQDTEDSHDELPERGVGMVPQAADRLSRRGVFI